MSEPRLITGYLAVLAAQLPASIVEELSDGLADKASAPAAVSWYIRLRRPPTTDHDPLISPACSSRCSAG